MAATHRHKELFERVVDALNDRDREGFAETHHADVVLHDHDEVFHGVEAAIKHEWDIYEEFPDMEYVPEPIIAEGDMVAARWRVKGTHEGELDGIPPTGESVDFPACGMLRIEDGAVSEVWLTYDQIGLMKQLGVLPEMEE